MTFYMSKSLLPDATQYLEDLKTGKIHPITLVQEYLDRLQKNHATLNAAVRVYREAALKQAEKPKPGPLSGLPVSVKECLAIAGEEVTLGSVRMPPIQTKEDAAVVKKLKEAGAILIARSNTAEFLLSRESNNLRFGKTNNPINPELTPGGSSGGEAALVSSGSSVFGIGTDIGGSIRMPAAFCGVVGFKPSSDAVDKTGGYPGVGGVAETMNAQGPICRSVRDTRLIYNVIAQKPVSGKQSIQGKSLLIPKQFQIDILDASIATAYGAAQEGLIRKGMKKEDLVIDNAGHLYKDYMAILVDAFLNKMYEWSVTREGQKMSLWAELGRKMMGKPTVSHPIFMNMLGMKTIRSSREKVDQLLASLPSVRTEFYDKLGKDRIMILPTVGTLATKHGVIDGKIGRPGVVGFMTPVTFCNLLNLPAITVPAWKFQKDDKNSPPGIMLVCAPGSEGTLLDVAEEMEGILN